MSEAGTRGRAGCVLRALAYPLGWILGLTIHVWTIVIAYRASGFFSAFLTFALPILGEVYWGIRIWRGTGSLMNDYTLALGAYAVLLVACGIAFHLMETDPT